MLYKRFLYVYSLLKFAMMMFCRNMTTKMRLATIGRNNKVSQHKVVEMAWWFIGSHYIYADRADEIFAWLMDGGVTNFETQPLINFQRIVTES